MTDINSWGYHLIIDAADADHDSITSYDNIYKFTKDLVKKIDMVAYGEPQIVNFGSGNKAGYTMVQLIETSNIVAHFCNETDTFYLDVFSCKMFNHEIVKELVNEYFKTTKINFNFLYRDAKMNNDLKKDNK